MTQRIINKTPHPVYVLNEDNSVLKVFPKSNGMIRVVEHTIVGEAIDGIPTCTTLWGEAEDVPEFKEDTFYIVSQLVKSVLPHRKDLLVPREIVRDSDGTIIGCRCFDRSVSN